MTDLFSDSSRAFVESQRKYDLRRLRLGMGIAAFVMVIGILQTQLFVSSLPCPSQDEVHKHIKASQDIQTAISVDYCNKAKRQLDPGITFKFFNDEQSKRLNSIAASLLEDEQLQSELMQSFGVSFRGLNVVVVPAWHMDTPDNDEPIGITLEGWKEASTSKGGLDVGGAVLRDRPSKQRITIDGRPRIMLNPKAFESTETLRLTLFHELLHAMNIPGFYPSALTFAQNDLTYLPEYRSFVRRKNLEGWNELRIWTLAVFVPFLIFLLIARRYRIRCRMED
jgi:hypothetical protein